jgi:hypothetical protein
MPGLGHRTAPHGLLPVTDLGSAHDEAELELLKAAARQRMAAGDGYGPATSPVAAL